MNIQRFRGDTYPMSWTLSVNGTAVNLSTAQSTTFAYQEGETVKTITGVYPNGGSDGKVNFTPSGTDFLSVGKMPYDIQVIDSSGARRTYVKATIEIIDDVNKG